MFSEVFLSSLNEIKSLFSCYFLYLIFILVYYTWFKHIFIPEEKDWAWLKCDEPFPGRIIYKGTHSHTQSCSNMSTSTKFKISKLHYYIVIKNQHFIEYFRLLQTSSECEMHLSAKCTIYTILYNTKVLKH